MMPWITAPRNAPPAGSLPPFPAIDEFHNLRLQQQNQQNEEAVLSVSDQRTLYLVNIFIVDTTRFLNRFSALCEEKLVDVHRYGRMGCNSLAFFDDLFRRMLRIDSSLTLLEEQLRSSS